jgi:methionine synthase II (cobalamin-independent)
LWVDGAANYYENGKRIDIPISIQEQSTRETFDVESAVDEFVDKMLEINKDAKVSVSMLYDEFKKMFPDEIDNLSFGIKKFGLELKKIIDAKGQSWDVVKKINGRIGEERGMIWKNLSLKVKRVGPSGPRY